MELTGEHMYKLSKIIDVTDIKIPDMDPTDTKQAYGAKVFIEIVRNIHKAKAELDDLSSDLVGKKISEMRPAEIKAFFKGVFEDAGVQGFF